MKMRQEWQPACVDYTVTAVLYNAAGAEIDRIAHYIPRAWPTAAEAQAVADQKNKQYAARAARRGATPRIKLVVVENFTDGHYALVGEMRL